MSVRGGNAVFNISQLPTTVPYENGPDDHHRDGHHHAAAEGMCVSSNYARCVMRPYRNQLVRVMSLGMVV